MPTVRDIAADLGVSPDEVLRRLREMGRPAASDLSAVEAGVAAQLRARVGAAPSSGPAPVRRAGPPPPPPPPRTSGAPGRAGDGRVNELWRPGGADASAGPAAPGRVGGGPVAAETRRSSSPARPRLLAQLAELPALILLAFVIAVLIKTFLVQAFFIPSGSMLPTLQAGDRVLVEKLSYRVRAPRAQDVVVFARSAFGGEPDLPWFQDARNFMRELLGLPTGAEQDYIKRVVAVGGDTLRYVGKPRMLYVNGKAVDEPYVKGGVDRFSPTLTAADCKRLKMPQGGGGCRVPDGTVFVMGDNRASSEDSRVIGPIPEDKIVGHAFVIIWPIADVGGL